MMENDLAAQTLYEMIQTKPNSHLYAKVLERIMDVYSILGKNRPKPVK